MGLVEIIETENGDKKHLVSDTKIDKNNEMYYVTRCTATTEHLFIHEYDTELVAHDDIENLCGNCRKTVDW